MNRESGDVRGTEGERLRRIKQQVDEAGPGWSGPFKPGTFGCHELLDRTSMLADQVERLIVDHTSILLDPEWFALAERALTALNDLYQRVGESHLDDEAESGNQAAFTGPLTRDH